MFQNHRAVMKTTKHRRGHALLYMLLQISEILLMVLFCFLPRMQTSLVMDGPLSCRRLRLQSHVFGVSQQYIIAAVLGIKHSVDKAYLLAVMACCGEDGRTDIRDRGTHSPCKMASQKGQLKKQQMLAYVFRTFVDLT